MAGRQIGRYLGRSRALRSLYLETSTSGEGRLLPGGDRGIGWQQCREGGARLNRVCRGYAAEAGAQSTGSSASIRSPVSYLSLALTMATGAGILWYYQGMREKKIKAAVGQAQSVGKAAIGGPFDLLDQDGKPFTHENLKGSFSVVYFGFTHCPDICPDELEKLAEALDSIEKRTGYQVRPVFITLDPERDSVAQVRSYVKEFHPRLIGLTGPSDKVKEAARAYRVYYSKTTDSEDDYLVDHSIIMYLVDPDGEFVTFYGKNFTAEQLAANIWDKVVGWNAEHPPATY